MSRGFGTSKGVGIGAGAQRKAHSVKPRVDANVSLRTVGIGAGAQRKAHSVKPRVDANVSLRTVGVR
ncbi:Hypothetical protein SMAX5B_020216 [Scophthalmus maximus]|uniref:Uncharacterized protein n=1 Tax=Scophthalmus maximus TaxID=52904 RepID=A0A2U9CL97_SCOMX|nr:Hypothetical protein SMAX5B_020216 [Scophthalmus maximus]